MATIEIKPHTGIQRGDNGNLIENCDTGIDAVWLVSREYPTPRRIGFVGRDAGAVVVFTVSCSESDKALAIEAVAQRNGAAPSTSDAVPLTK